MLYFSSQLDSMNLFRLIFKYCLKCFLKLGRNTKCNEKTEKVVFRKDHLHFTHECLAVKFLNAFLYQNFISNTFLEKLI